MTELVVTKPDLSAGASAVWDAVTPALIADCRLMPGDELVFADYCEMQATADLARAEFQGGGMILIADGKKAQKNPAFNVWKDASSAARAIAVQFGIGPKSRKQLGIKQRGAAGAKSVADTLGPRR